MTNPFDPDPRVMGAREHLERAKWFCLLADQTSDATEQHRLRFAAVYSARAIVEIILVAAEEQTMRSFGEGDKRKRYESCEQQIAPKLPHYQLIEKLRIHDFHRFGCVPPRPGRTEMFFGGTLKLTASSGAAVLGIPSSGPEVTVTGNSTVKDQRTLCAVDGTFYDEVSKSYLTLKQIVAEYLGAAPAVIGWFQQEVDGNA